MKWPWATKPQNGGVLVELVLFEGQPCVFFPNTTATTSEEADYVGTWLKAHRGNA